MKFLLAMVVLTLGIIDAGLGAGQSWNPQFLTEDWICVNWTDCSEPCGGGKRSCERVTGKSDWHFDCHVQDCKKNENCGKADVVFIFDRSASIREHDYWITKQFAVDVIKGLNNNNNNDTEDVRIGMVTFADEASTHWALEASVSEDALESAIWGLPMDGENTNIEASLWHAEHIIGDTGRDGVPDIVVLITDGVANINKDKTVPKAEELHAQDIEIFAIGVGNGIDEEELRGIASRADYMHHVPDYTALTHITRLVISETCDATIPKTCGEMDLVIILDSSNSIGKRHWSSAKQFAIEVTQGLLSDSPDVHIATVTFSTSATTEWTLGEYTKEEDLVAQLSALPWGRGYTNSQEGLTHAKQVFESSGRPGVPKVAIFLSDGESNIKPELTIPAAQALHDDGVHVFAIAVRVAGIDELKAIASEPEDKYYKHADSYDELVDICKTIITEACEEGRK